VIETASPTALKSLSVYLRSCGVAFEPGDGHRDAAPDQHRRVRHHRDHPRLATQAGLEAAEREPGGDGHEELSRRHLGADLVQEPGHRLRLHGQDDRLRLAHQGAVVPRRLDLVEPLHAAQLGVHRIARPHVVRLELAGVQHALEQRPSHVPGTDEADLLHEPSPPRTVRAARSRASVSEECTS
jgi:hypothetical protein